MNERIRLLAEQAIVIKTVFCEGWEGKNYTKTEEVFDKEKFAELIVRECADIATVNQYQAYTAGHYVLKHFGVEL